MTGNLVIMFFGEPFGGLIPGAQGAVLAALMRTGTPLTGRRVHSLLRDDLSLWTVQEALKTLSRLGLVSTQTVGRAGLHSINDEHYAIAPLRQLLSPLSVLKEIIHEAVGDEVKAVIVFGSVGRDDSKPDSDVDLAVIARKGWDDGARIADLVRSRLGNECDVLAFTPAEFSRLATVGEPVVGAILADGVPLLGSMPRVKPGAA
jgi:predicted nucleotidyltransferase